MRATHARSARALAALSAVTYRGYAMFACRSACGSGNSSRSSTITWDLLSAVGLPMVVVFFLWGNCTLQRSSSCCFPGVLRPRLTCALGYPTKFSSRRVSVFTPPPDSLGFLFKSGPAQRSNSEGELKNGQHLTQQQRFSVGLLAPVSNP